MKKEKEKNYMDLVVWQKSHEFVMYLYRTTKQRKVNKVAKILKSYCKTTQSNSNYQLLTTNF